MSEKYLKTDFKPCVEEILNQVKTKINRQNIATKQLIEMLDKVIILQNSKASIIPLIRSIIEFEKKIFEDDLEQILEYLDDTTQKMSKGLENRRSYLISQKLEINYQANKAK